MMMRVTFSLHTGCPTSEFDLQRRCVAIISEKMLIANRCTFLFIVIKINSEWNFDCQLSWEQIFSKHFNWLIWNLKSCTKKKFDWLFSSVNRSATPSSTIQFCVQLATEEKISFAHRHKRAQSNNKQRNYRHITDKHKAEFICQVCFHRKFVRGGRLAQVPSIADRIIEKVLLDFSSVSDVRPTTLFSPLVLSTGENLHHTNISPNYGRSLSGSIGTTRVTLQLRCILHMRKFEENLQLFVEFCACCHLGTYNSFSDRQLHWIRSFHLTIGIRALLIIRMSLIDQRNRTDFLDIIVGHWTW